MTSIQSLARNALCSLSGFFAPQIGEKQIKGFERDTLKVVKELLQLPREEFEDLIVISLNKVFIRGALIKSGTVYIDGISQNALCGLSSKGSDFGLLQTVSKVSFEMVIAAASLQAYLEQKFQKQEPENRIFEKIQLKIEDGKTLVDGEVKLGKLANFPFSFFSRTASKFRASFSILIKQDKLLLDIEKCWLNGISLSQEQKTQILSGLNPIWVFSKLPYPVGLEYISMDDSGLAVKGWLFAR